MRRLVRHSLLLLRWYATATGAVYAVLVAAAVTTSFFSVRWGLILALSIVAIAIPYKLARIEGARRDATIRSLRRERELARLQSQVDGQTAELGSRVAELTSQLAQTKGSIDGVDTRAQQLRRDALTAVDTARHEWAEIVRAERRLTEANVRSTVNRQLDAALSTLRSEGPEQDASQPTPSSPASTT